ncbi:MAG: methyltransferase domain-containing protein [Phycisphaerae bacterium]|nr:methyltransferase domain-containing protein [Phycisphaerae bacterium]
MSLSLRQLEYLCTPEAAAILSADLPADPLAAQKKLRKNCTTEQAVAVGALRELRHRAERKFPATIAENMLTTDKMLQQASSLRLAVWKGQKLRAAGAEQVWDLCCGFGADAIGFARGGCDVVGVDVSPEAVFCAAHNTAAAGVGEKCIFRQADAEQIFDEIPTEAMIHIDPDRRATGRRSIRLDDYAPGENFLQSLLQHAAGGCMKLSPAMDFSLLCDWPGVRLEHISEAGVCKQLLAWWGDAADGKPTRAATVVAGEAEAPRATTLPAGQAGLAEIADVGAWLIEPDPAVIAADAADDLAAKFDLWRLDPSLAWLSGAEPVDTPLAGCYRVLETVAGRPNDVRRAVVRLDGGTVIVKPRGLKLDTDRLQKSLSGKGDRRLAIFWTQINHKQIAYIAEMP